MVGKLENYDGDRWQQIHSRLDPAGLHGQIDVTHTYIVANRQTEPRHLTEPWMMEEITMIGLTGEIQYCCLLIRLCE